MHTVCPSLLCILKTLSQTHVLHAQVNSRYAPQLQEVLQWPQSAGIVGGRPSSSLYFVGHQGYSVLFLDPHEVQEVRLRMPVSVLVEAATH